MKTPKTVVEGYFEIPYWGQMRFSAILEGDQVVFADGDKAYNHYFGSRITTYQMSEKPERQYVLTDNVSEIKKFMEGKDTSTEIKVDFKCELFGQMKMATGCCKLYRFYI